MSSQKLLRIANALSDEGEWSRVLTGFEVTVVPGLAEASGALSRDEFDCVLISGEAPDGSAIEALELAHTVDPGVTCTIASQEIAT